MYLCHHCPVVVSTLSQRGEGQLVAVIGPNGAGRTTLFNLITGQLRRDRGKIAFMEEDISGLPAQEICKRGIARSFQIVNVFPRLTVFQNVQIAILSQQRKSTMLFRPARSLAVGVTRTILEILGLFGKTGDIARSLSHGDQKILEIAIARALTGNPVLLLLDGPTEGLAPTLIWGLETQLARLRVRGLTVLLAKQNVRSALRLSDRGYIIDDGKIRYEGSIEDIKKNEEVRRKYLLI